MSLEALIWVFKNSPYPAGATFCVQLAIADWANDQHDNELFAPVKDIAEKAHVSQATCHRAISRLVEDRYLKVLDSGGGRGKPRRYHVNTKGSQDERVPAQKGSHLDAERVSSEESVLLLTQENTSLVRASRRTSAPEDFKITSQMWQWLEDNKLGLSVPVVERETAQFLDHHRAKGSLMVNWEAAWRTWMRRVPRPIKSRNSAVLDQVEEQLRAEGRI